MRSVFNWNPYKYDDSEILKLCELTTLTYPEIAAMEGVTPRVVLRICGKKVKRASGRPRQLTKEDIAYKISKVVSFYKKQRRNISPIKLDRLVKYLTEKLKKEDEIKKVPQRRSKKLNKDEYLSHELALVVDFLVEKHRKQEQEIPFTMALFAKFKKINYDQFTRIVKRRIKEAWPIAEQQILRSEKSQLEEKYREHVIEYLAKQEVMSQSGKILNKLDYVEHNGLDYSVFLKFFKKYRALVKDAVLVRYRELEEDRLQQLRTIESKTDPILEGLGQWSIKPPEGYQETSPVQLLEKIARKKLPVRKGRVVFNSNKKENKHLEDVWLQIADDISKVGLIDAVAQKWEHEINLPSTIPQKERFALILLRIETVLKQLDMFLPPRTLSFEQLSNWLQPEKIKKLISEEKTPISEILEVAPLIAPVVPSSTIYDERWLEQEIMKEEIESRRYLDTVEEHLRRRRDGFIIPANLAEILTKSQVEDLKNMGALYDKGDWLLLTETDLAKFTSQPHVERSRPTRRPKLLIAIGTEDYTKEWMHKAFEIKITNDPHSFHNLVISFKPDALMIYKSSSGRKIYDEVSDIAKQTGLPLLIFDRGFADLLLTAEKQNVRWFIEAYQRRRTLQRRFNPFHRKFNFYY